MIAGNLSVPKGRLISLSCGCAYRLYEAFDDMDPAWELPAGTNDDDGARVSINRVYSKAGNMYSDAASAGRIVGTKEMAWVRLRRWTISGQTITWGTIMVMIDDIVGTPANTPGAVSYLSRYRSSGRNG